MKRAVEFRRSAREALRGKWGPAVIACLVATLLGGASSLELDFDLDFIFGRGEQDASSNTLTLKGILRSIADGSIQTVLLAVGIALFTGLVALAVFTVIGGVVSAGYAKFNLQIVDNRDAEIRNLFEYFDYWRSLAVTQLLRAVYTFLWALLFIVPGIIASYSYAMTPYILAEFPATSPKEAIEASKKMMDGNKYRLFCLEVSFIGWHALCVLSFGIGYLWLNPYVNAAKADFYREISGTRPVMDIPLEDFFVNPDD